MKWNLYVCSLKQESFRCSLILASLKPSSESLKALYKNGVRGLSPTPTLPHQPINDFEQVPSLPCPRFPREIDHTVFNRSSYFNILLFILFNPVAYSLAEYQALSWSLTRACIENFLHIRYCAKYFPNITILRYPHKHEKWELKEIK